MLLGPGQTHNASIEQFTLIKIEKKKNKQCIEFQCENYINQRILNISKYGRLQAPISISHKPTLSSRWAGRGQRHRRTGTGGRGAPRASLRPGFAAASRSSRWAGRGHRHRRAGRAADSGRRGVPRASLRPPATRGGRGTAARAPAGGARCGLPQLAVGGARPLGHRARGAGRGQRRERGFAAGEARTPEVRDTGGSRNHRGFAAGFWRRTPEIERREIIACVSY